jgi:hypothetical protein
MSDVALREEGVKSGRGLSFFRSIFFSGAYSNFI